MKKFALLILVVCCMVSFWSCVGKSDEDRKNDNIEQATQKLEEESSENDDNSVVVDASLFEEGEYKNERGVLTIYNVSTRGFCFKIKVFDKTDTSKIQGTIGYDSEKVFAKYKCDNKAILRGIDTEMTEDEDYNIELTLKNNDTIVITETRNDGSRDVINPYSDLGTAFSGVYKKNRI